MNVLARLARRLRSRLCRTRASISPDVPDAAFVELCYQRLLGRPSDPQGKELFTRALGQGMARLDLASAIASSPEYFGVLVRRLFGGTDLPDLGSLHPQRYRLSSVVGEQRTLPTFDAGSPEAFDWIESMIQSCGFYERAGEWSLAIDTDKQVMAEIAGRFSPGRVLDMGCSTGAILHLLNQQGIRAEGVEISHLALGLSYHDIRPQIHFGDLLSLGLEPGFDLILCLDILEHLNPNRIDSYIARCASLLRPGGFLFANIPVFGRDTLFGEVFRMYFKEWTDDAARGRPFSLLHVDDRGWPINGHLIWADPAWWQRLFAQHGLQREAEVEKAIRIVYGAHFARTTPGRSTFFLFSRQAAQHDCAAIAARVLSSRSKFVTTEGGTP